MKECRLPVRDGLAFGGPAPRDEVVRREVRESGEESACGVGPSGRGPSAHGRDNILEFLAPNLLQGAGDLL